MSAFAHASARRKQHVAAPEGEAAPEDEAAPENVAAVEEAVLQAAAEAVAEVSSLITEANGVSLQPAEELSDTPGPARAEPSGEKIAQPMVDESENAPPVATAAEPTDAEMLEYLLRRIGMSRAELVREFQQAQGHDQHYIRTNAAAMADEGEDDEDADDEHAAVLEAHAALLEEAVGGASIGADMDDLDDAEALAARAKHMLAHADAEYRLSRPMLD